VDNPEIAIAVVAENAGHGSSVAAPIAGEILRYYFAQCRMPVDSHTVSPQAQ
jgi:cell division protein FtsI/penicillin-binding protein 2